MDTQPSAGPPRVAGPDSSEDAVRTYRYLRLSMVAMVLLLAVAVLIERLAAPGCWQTSISGYYYTPVQPMFVGCLVTVGVALIALRGSTPWEDILLNLAGLCSFLVAAVPMSSPGPCSSAASSLVDTWPTTRNSFLAFVVAGGLCLVAAALLDRRNPSAREVTREAVRRPVLGFAAALLLGAVFVALYAWARTFFVAHGHDVAAVPMFVLLTVVAVLNRQGSRSTPTSRRVIAGIRLSELYAVIAALMAVTLAAAGVLAFLDRDGGLGWDHWTLVIEVVLLGAFALFWSLQTYELWFTGLRGPGPDAHPSPTVGE